MSNYVKATNFASKDALSVTDPAKVIKGTEIDNEYNAIASAVSSKADTNSPSFTGTPTVPTATAGSNTTQIASCAFVLANSVPVGFIGMWSGTIATIPSGWALCNGSSGTPDLRDKFIIGASSDDTALAKTNITGALTQTGGTKDSVVVSHTHTATVSDPGHNHTQRRDDSSGAGAGGNPDAGGGTQEYGTTGTSTTGISVSNSTTGVSGTNANLPPYYALAFIMKT